MTDRKRRTFKAMAGGTIAALATAAMLNAPQAAANSDPIPEWYQYCYDQTPGQTMTGKQGVSPPFFYKNARANKNGVDCIYMTLVAIFVPKETTIHHSLDDICRGMGLGKHGYWGDGYPRCKN